MHGYDKFYFRSALPEAVICVYDTNSTDGAAAIAQMCLARMLFTCRERIIAAFCGMRLLARYARMAPTPLKAWRV